MQIAVVGLVALSALLVILLKSRGNKEERHSSASVLENIPLPSSLGADGAAPSTILLPAATGVRLLQPTDESGVPQRFPAVQANSLIAVESESVTGEVASQQLCMPLVTGPKPGRQGQVVGSTTFAQALRRAVRQFDVQLALEIGTWYGGGSTFEIASALVELGAECTPAENAKKCCSRGLITVEVFEPAYNHARQFLQDLPVWCVRGSTVSVEEMLGPDEIPNKDEHFRLYYERDRALMASMEPQLRPLCESHHFDFVLIDGNEYTGLGEFRLVHSNCKPRVLALHDMGTLKTNAIQAYIDTHPNEYKLVEKGNDGPTMWGVFERIDR